MAGWTDDVEKPLFLRRFGVPFWALAHVFGKDAMYWYQLAISLGRNSVVQASWVACQPSVFTVRGA